MNDVLDWRKSGAEIFWGEIAPCEHLVQIYEDDCAFLDCLEGFISGGLKAGEAVIIIATKDHLSILDYRLRANGHDLHAARANGQYFPYDAEECLAKFMVKGWPDETLFKQVVNSVISKARGRNDRPVRAFGEMVAVLWADGHNGATVRLEHLWHQFMETETFSLFCAYPKSGFTKNADESIREICDTHSKVVAG